MKRTLSRLTRLTVLLLFSAGAVPTFGYSGKEHQYLTFLAAKHFNRCVTGTDIPLLTPLQVRYMARSNVDIADRTMFARMFNWRYYDREGQSERSLLWVIDTRFHDHFNELTLRMQDADDPMDVYRDLGRVLSYVQLVTSPAHVVPVYTARFWRFSFSDRFDSYPLDRDALDEALGDDCGFLDNPVQSLEAVLGATAGNTMGALTDPIRGMPANWSAFWEPGEGSGDFGEYGPAGNNFGRKTDFRCGERERCVLLKDDPLYAEFALARHIQAVQGTLGAMLIAQTGVRDQLASAK